MPWDSGQFGVDTASSSGASSGGTGDTSGSDTAAGGDSGQPNDIAGAGDGATSDGGGATDAGSCEKTADPAEICDGKDNDCNGKIDDVGCDDGNVCTTDTCDPSKYDGTDAKSGCLYSLANGVPCGDGTNKCVTDAKCQGTVCTGGTTNTCNDDNSCTIDDCVEATGACQNLPLNPGTFCDDGLGCTNNDVCIKDAASVKCVGTVTGACADQNPCTVDTCDSKGNCSNIVQVNTPCNDGNPCTAGDTCFQAGCTGTKNTICDDGNPCTNDVCNQNQGGCVVTKVPAGTLCTKDACNKQGTCDSNGQCDNFAITCDDKNPCTTDICDANSGQCTNTALQPGTPCNDGDPCTTGEKCSAQNKCDPPAGQAGCDDGNACTDDSCNIATLKCLSKPKAVGSQCDDGDKCTKATFCYGGTCALGASPKVTSIAGTGTAGWVDGAPAKALFKNPRGLAYGPGGDLYIADRDNSRIRVVLAAGGDVKTYAGDGTPSFLDGAAASARFNAPHGIAVDVAGVVYVSDRGNHRIRAISAAGIVSTLAGNGGATFKDGKGTAASFNSPEGIAVDSKGVLYVADAANHRIRVIAADGTVTTLAGDSASGNTDGKGTAARFYQPHGVAVDANGAVYVADAYNHRIRKIGTDGTVTTVAGSSAGFIDGAGTTAKFQYPTDVVLDGTGALIVSDRSNHRVRRMSTTLIVTTLAGSGTVGFADGDGTQARFNLPWGLTVAPNGDVFVADASNQRIRRIESPVTVCDDASPCTVDSCSKTTGQCVFQPLNVGSACDDGSVCTAKDACNAAGKCSGFAKPCVDGNACTDDTCNPLTGDCVFAPNSLKCDDGDKCTQGDTCLAGKCQAGAGQISSIAGEGTAQATDHADALQGSTNYPADVSQDGKGTLYIAEHGGNKIRRFTIGGKLETYAGSGQGAYADGKGAAAAFNSPGGLVAAADGTVYVADTGNHRIRTIDKEAVVTSLAGSGTGAWADGQGVKSGFNGPRGITIDAFGNLFVADSGNNRIRKVDGTGTVTTFAGNYGNQLVDGKGSQAQFNAPAGITAGPNGELFVADTKNNAIRRIKADGTVTTLAGQTSGGHTNATGEKAQFLGPIGIAFDGAGGVMVADSLNNVIRRVTLDGVVATVAGDMQKQISGFKDGDPDIARFSQPHGVSVDVTGRLFVADRNNSRIRMMAAAKTLCDDGKLCTKDACGKTTGVCTNIKIGSGAACDDGDPCTAGEVCDSAGACKGPAKVCDDKNGCTKDACSPFSGGCQFDPIEGFCNDGDPCTTTDLCISGKCSGDIGIVETLAGSGSAGFTDGPGNTARFQRPRGIDADDAGNVFVADQYNHRIRKIDPQGTVSTWAGSGSPSFTDGPWNQARFYYPGGLILDGGQIYVADLNNHRIRRIDPNRDVSTHSGSGSAGFADGPPSTAKFYYPHDITGDRKGTFYVADRNNHRIRKVDSGGNATTVAGTGSAGFTDGPGSSARFYYPRGIALDQKGHAWVADYNNYRIRRVAPNGTVTTVVGNGTPGASGNYVDGKGIGATVGYTWDIAIMPNGDAIIPDYQGYTVRRITWDGVITTWLGQKAKSGHKDGVASEALFGGPWGVGVDSKGNVYTGGYNDHRVRRISNPVKQCNDGNDCTTEKCDPQTGQCKATPVNDGETCSSDKPCLVGRVCNVGKCVGGVPRDCNDKNSCTIDSCDGATGACVYKAAANCVPYRQVFVTSDTFLGNVGPYVEGVDAKCQGLAAKAGLQGKWLAWIGGRTIAGAYVGPTNTFSKGTSSYRLLNGTLIANDWNDLIDGSLAAPINQTELGTTAAKGTTDPGCSTSIVGGRVWTNTTTNGNDYSTSSIYKCSYWSTPTTSTSYRVYVGDTSMADTKWTQACPTGRCNVPGHLYCFSQTDAYGPK